MAKLGFLSSINPAQTPINSRRISLHLGKTRLPKNHFFIFLMYKKKTLIKGFVIL